MRAKDNFINSNLNIQILIYNKSGVGSPKSGARNIE